MFEGLVGVEVHGKEEVASLKHEHLIALMLHRNVLLNTNNEYQQQ